MNPVKAPLISLQPRSSNECLDLAFRYTGHFAGQVLGIWMLIALPASGLVYGLARWGEFDLRFAVMVTYFASLPLGGLLINDTVSRVFRRHQTAASTRPSPGRFSVSAALIVCGLSGAYLAARFGDQWGLGATVRRWSVWTGTGLAFFLIGLRTMLLVARSQKVDLHIGRMFFLGLCFRSLCVIGPVLVLFPPLKDWRLAALLIVTIIPGIWLALKTGFLMEEVCLSRLNPDWAGPHIKDLVQDETGELFGRAVWMSQFSLILCCVIFITFDAASSLLFRFPIFAGRFGQIPSGVDFPVYLELAGNLLLRDPLVLAVLTATSLFVYVLNRLAWFFCYIDIRVRRDCWDLEVEMEQEVQRLWESDS